MQDKQHGVHERLSGDRRSVNVVAGLAPGRESVHVGPEADAVFTEELQHLLTRVMLYSVECHMLQKMCEAVLVVILLKRTDIVHDVEIRHSGRIRAMPDIVSQSVVKFPCPDLSV